MSAQVQPQINFMQLVNELLATAKVKYADRTDADNVIDNISARSRMAVYGQFGKNILLEQYNELMAKCGQYEVYLPLLAAKYKNATDDLREANIKLDILQKTEAERLAIRKYIQENYKEYFLDSKELAGNDLQYYLEENISTNLELIGSEIFNFCHKKLIKIVWN